MADLLRALGWVLLVILGLIFYRHDAELDGARVLGFVGVALAMIAIGYLAEIRDAIQALKEETKP